LKRQVVVQRFYRQQQQQQHRGRPNGGNNPKDSHQRGRGGGGGGGNRRHRGNDKAKKVKTHEFVVGWVEAKMFYGASTIPQDGGSAVGCLAKTARKYVRAYGPGAMVFAYGCGDRLARELEDLGVLALDCGCSDAVDLAPVEGHQRTWCANPDGEILP
jgi:hypothetical protein